MPLAPGEQQVLAEIESRLRRSDPRLAARLALFRRRAARGLGPARELLSPWRARRRRLLPILVLVVALTLAIAGIMLAARGGQPHGAALASAVCSRPVHAGAGGGLGPVCYRRGPSRRMMLMPVTKFGVETASGVPVVTAPEEIDINNAAGLRTAVLEAAAHGQGTFVVDMSRTQFCDSAGLHVLVGAHKRALAEGGEVRLVIPGPDVLRIFAITGLDHVFPNFSTLEEALAQAPAEGVQGRAL